MSELMTPPPDGAQSAALRARLDRLHRELAAQARRTNRSTLLTAVVAAVALVALGGYFAYGYTQIEEVTRPEKLVDVAQLLIDENLPTARKAVEDEVVKSAPTWAEGLSKQAVAALPMAREKLRDYATERMDASLDQATLMSEEQFREFLRRNRAELERMFKDLADNPQRADASLGELEKMLEAQLKSNMQATSGELLTALTSCNAKLKRLGAAQGLSREEQIERRVLMLARRLQEERSGTGTAPAPPLAKSAAGGGR
jgi:hypothetical protein